MIIHMFDIGIRMIAFDWHSYVGNTWNLFDIFAICGSLATTIVLLFQPLNQAAAQFVIVRRCYLLLIDTRLQKLFLVGVLFKLAQRSDSLNQLFKIAVYVWTLMSNGKPLNFDQGHHCHRSQICSCSGQLSSSFGPCCFSSSSI